MSSGSFSGLFDEPCLDEVLIERESRGELSLGHDDEGDAVRQRVPLVLVASEVVEAPAEQIFVNMHELHRGASEEPLA